MRSAAGVPGRRRAQRVRQRALQINLERLAELVGLAVFAAVAAAADVRGPVAAEGVAATAGRRCPPAPSGRSCGCLAAVSSSGRPSSRRSRPPRVSWPPPATRAIGLRGFAVKQVANRVRIKGVERRRRIDVGDLIRQRVELVQPAHLVERAFQRERFLAAEVEAFAQALPAAAGRAWPPVGRGPSAAGRRCSSASIVCCSSWRCSGVKTRAVTAWRPCALQAAR